MIKRFILPERLALAPEYPIGLAGCDAFQPSHDSSHVHDRSKEKVGMVRHDYIGVQIVEPKLGLAVFDGVHNQAGYAGIFHPMWAQSSPVEQTIPFGEGAARVLRRNRFVIGFVESHRRRQCAVQAPSDE